MNLYYYTNLEGEVIGPEDLQTIRKELAEGMIPKEVKLSIGGSARWMTLAEVEQLEKSTAGPQRVESRRQASAELPPVVPGVSAPKRKVYAESLMAVRLNSIGLICFLTSIFSLVIMVYCLLTGHQEWWAFLSLAGTSFVSGVLFKAAAEALSFLARIVTAVENEKPKMI